MAAIAKDAILSSLEENLFRLVPRFHEILKSRFGVDERLYSRGHIFQPKLSQQEIIDKNIIYGPCPIIVFERPKVFFDDEIIEDTYGSVDFEELQKSARALLEGINSRVNSGQLSDYGRCREVLYPFADILPIIIEGRPKEEVKEAVRQAKSICEECFCDREDPDGASRLDGYEFDEGLRSALLDFIEKLRHLKTTFICLGDCDGKVIRLYLNAIFHRPRGNRDFSGLDFDFVDHVYVSNQYSFGSTMTDFDRVACTFAHELFHYFHMNRGAFPTGCSYSNSVILETLASKFADACYPRLQHVDRFISVVDYPYAGYWYLPRVEKKYGSSYFRNLLDSCYSEEYFPPAHRKASRAILMLLDSTQELIEVLRKDEENEKALIGRFGMVTLEEFESFLLNKRYAKHTATVYKNTISKINGGRHRSLVGLVGSIDSAIKEREPGGAFYSDSVKKHNAPHAALKAFKEYLISEGLIK